MRKARTAKKPHETRLLRLAAWIIDQSEPVTRGQIFEAFPDEYGGNPDAAERKFTRDKDALKRLGFNLETAELGGRDEQIGYAIDARTSMLPPVELAPDERAAALRPPDARRAGERAPQARRRGEGSAPARRGHGGSLDGREHGRGPPP